MEEEEYPVLVSDLMGFDPNERAENNDFAQFWGSLVLGCCILWTVVVSAILAIVGRL